MMVAFGPVPTLRELLRDVDGIPEAFVDGS
jgi:hypothetical protein